MKIILTTINILAFAAFVFAQQPIDVLRSQNVQNLNGEWRFKYHPALEAGNDESFFQPTFDVAAWKRITVPGHWELQGFAEPQYGGELKEGTGLYRRTFRVNKLWKNQRVFLRFDGVLYGFKAYVNGKAVGEWGSGFNPATFDVTDALKPGNAENTLAVRVTTRNKGWDFDVMDCWSLSGIFRDVTLFAVPQVHFKDYTYQTTFRPDGTADLKVDAVTSAAANVTVKLTAPDGKKIKEFQLNSTLGKATTTVEVKQPQLWTAESPFLYRLELELKSDGKVVQRYSERIGLRQVTTDGGILKLNGVPIKLRGVNHHDIWANGKVSTEEGMRQDLELIKAANINFIRTAHYPPHPRFIEICDELGIYVLDEVPYVQGRKNLTNPDYQEVLLKRARATVMRDKNRPSVIMWGSGNENPFTELGNNTVKHVKELDPTRPTMLPTAGSYFRENYQKYPDFVDIISTHYPNVQRIADYAVQFQRPLLFTEYAHQRGLTRAGSSVQDQWEMMYQHPRVAGGAIWVFQDQGILRTATDMNSVKDGDLKVWIDKNRYYDTYGYAGMDGLVYTDRTPQVDYWQVRKVYSPIQISEKEFNVKPGTQKLTLTVENRFDFKSLTGTDLNWSLKRNGKAIQQGVQALIAKPKERQNISINLELPADLVNDVFSLELHCVDEKGVQIYERAIRLNAAQNSRWSTVESALTKSEPRLEMTESSISVNHASFLLKLDRTTGQLSLNTANGEALVTAFGPNVGGNPTINDIGRNREIEPLIWAGRLLSGVTELKTDARKVPEGVEIAVSGNYPRPNKPDESIRGDYRMLVKPTGMIELRYEYVPANASGEMLQAGFAFSIPTTLSEFRWIGQGPYAAYPGKDRLSEFGIFHLNRDDLYFPGNRREVEIASISDISGSGIVLGGTNMTVDVERKDNQTVLSHIALVPDDMDSETNDVNRSSRIKATSVKRISGSLKLLPLQRNWLAPLTKWFGPANQRVPVNRPFLRSFDQSNDRLEKK